MEKLSPAKQETFPRNRTNVEFFDPPMCCPTGVCGPVLDQTLLDVNEMIMTFQSKGYFVNRYQMASDPNAFLNNQDVMVMVRAQQMNALPITVVNGKVIKSGEYPTLLEVEAALNGGSR